MKIFGPHENLENLKESVTYIKKYYKTFSIVFCRAAQADARYV